MLKIYGGIRALDSFLRLHSPYGVEDTLKVSEILYWAEFTLGSPLRVATEGLDPYRVTTFDLHHFNPP
jgi:hypothetical protein